jgi:hypothetical protein
MEAAILQQIESAGPADGGAADSAVTVHSGTGNGKSNGKSAPTPTGKVSD